ncbi:Zinc finger protein [Globisporangium polare]
MAHFHNNMYAHPMSSMSQLPVLLDPMQDATMHIYPQYHQYHASDHAAVHAPVYKCEHPGCDRQFNRKYTLAEHAMTHTGEKPHVCPVPTCAKSFSTSGNLSRHKRLHGYIEPLKCPVQGCVCTFPSNNKLSKHMKFHFGSEDVKVCVVVGCGKTFSTTGNLNRHLKAVHDGVAYETESPVNRQYSPSAPEQWAPKHQQYHQQPQRTTGYFEPDGIRPYAPPVLYAPVVPVMAAPWGTEELDALAGLFESSAPVAQVDSQSIDLFRDSLHFEYRQ